MRHPQLATAEEAERGETPATKASPWFIFWAGFFLGVAVMGAVCGTVMLEQANAARDKKYSGALTDRLLIDQVENVVHGYKREWQAAPQKAQVIACVATTRKLHPDLSEENIDLQGRLRWASIDVYYRHKGDAAFSGLFATFDAVGSQLDAP